MPATKSVPSLCYYLLRPTQTCALESSREEWGRLLSHSPVATSPYPIPIAPHNPLSCPHFPITNKLPINMSVPHKVTSRTATTVVPHFYATATFLIDIFSPQHVASASSNFGTGAPLLQPHQARLIDDVPQHKFARVALRPHRKAHGRSRALDQRVL
jgi:hypothetical protein